MSCLLVMRVADAEYLSRVRERACRALQAWRWPSESDIWDITVAISELVANAILHGQMPIRAVLSMHSTQDGHEVVFRVTDARPDLQTRVDRPDNGRGIEIVRALTDSFGVENAPGGKAVYFTKKVS
jgi:anti-sigma regulatory factor (Ser/Thr protein kinase)